MNMDKVNWEGGQIEVTKETNGGWGIQHRTKDGGVYPIDWMKFKSDAVRAARKASVERKAKVLVEVV
jgi:hypothetical protein